MCVDRLDEVDEAKRLSGSVMVIQKGKLKFDILKTTRCVCPAYPIHTTCDFASL